VILVDTIIKVFCADGHKRWHVGEFALDVADPADGLLYFPDAPPLWVFAEEFGKVSRKKRTRSARQHVGDDGRHIGDNDWLTFTEDGAMICDKAALDVMLNARVRYKLVCDHCRYTHERKEDELHVVLDRLAAAGMREISLRGLDSIKV
jgi:hypothetical protein